MESTLPKDCSLLNTRHSHPFLAHMSTGVAFLPFRANELTAKLQCSYYGEQSCWLRQWLVIARKWLTNDGGREIDFRIDLDWFLSQCFLKTTILFLG